MRILVTGFEAFGGRETNPTAQLIQALKLGQLSIPSDSVIEGLLLPVTFDDAFDILWEKSKQFRPDAILALGLAANRDAIELERVAINCMDADIPDNKGERPIDKVIIPDGKEAFFSTLPLRKIESSLQRAGIPVRISNTAGTYVCNYLFYRMMESHRNKLCGFVHFPLQDVLPHATQVLALETMIGAICSTES